MSVPYKILDDGDLILYIRLTPAASKNEIKGVEIDLLGDTYIKATVTAIPENGKANAALIKLLSKTYKIPKSAMIVDKGAKGRMKMIKIRSSEVPEKPEHVFTLI